MTWTAFSLFVISLSGINFPKEWCRCIKQYCITFEENPHPTILVTKVPSLCELVSSSAEFLMPACMLWSPLKQYPTAYCCPKCTSTSAVGLTPVRCQDGSSSTAAPRMIYTWQWCMVQFFSTVMCTSALKGMAYWATIQMLWDEPSTSAGGHTFWIVAPHGVHTWPDGTSIFIGPCRYE